MAPKRKSTTAMKAMKRSRHNEDVPTVVNALVHSQALPENLRNLLKTTLPIVLDADKADRHSFEAEVVDQAQQGLTAVQSAMEQAHKDAVASQNQVISPGERAKRVKAVADAKAHLEAMKAKVEQDKAAKKAAEQAVEDAKGALQAAKKEDKAADKELQRYVDKKTHVESVLAQEFVMLRDGTSAGAGGKKAVATLVAVGKEFGLDSTLLMTLPVTCKKQAEHYTEFESMMFKTLEGLMGRVITDLTQHVAQAEPVKAAKSAAAEAAAGALANAEAALKAASDELENQQQATSAANKAVHQADASRRHIWEDMRQVCDAADGAAEELKNLKEHVWACFQKLKEKEPEPEEPEEPEPVEEAAEEAAPEASPEPEVQASPEASPEPEASPASAN